MLVLWVNSKLNPNTFHKSSRVAKIFEEESLKFVPRYGNVYAFFQCIPTLIQSPASTNTVLKKRGRKRCMIIPISSSYIKIIFALLVEQIAIQMWFFVIQVGKANLRGLLLWLYWRCRDLDWGLDMGLILEGVHIGLHKKLEKLLNWWRRVRCRGALQTISTCWGPIGQWT